MAKDEYHVNLQVCEIKSAIQQLKEGIAKDYTVLIQAGLSELESILLKLAVGVNVYGCDVEEVEKEVGTRRLRDSNPCCEVPCQIPREAADDLCNDALRYAVMEKKVQKILIKPLI